MLTKDNVMQNIHPFICRQFSWPCAVLMFYCQMLSRSPPAHSVSAVPSLMWKTSCISTFDWQQQRLIIADITGNFDSSCGQSTSLFPHTRPLSLKQVLTQCYLCRFGIVLFFRYTSYCSNSSNGDCREPARIWMLPLMVKDISICWANGCSELGTATCRA